MSTQLDMRPVEHHKPSIAGPSKARKHCKRGSGKGHHHAQSNSQPPLTTKVHWYIHNLTHIRPFLRVQILDPSLTHQPLSIAQWHTALWGDYLAKELPDSLHGSPSTARMAQCCSDEMNGMARLFAQVAQLCSYNVFEPATFEGGVVDTISVVFDIAGETHRKMLWEAHKINF